MNNLSRLSFCGSQNQLSVELRWIFFNLWALKEGQEKTRNCGRKWPFFGTPFFLGEIISPPPPIFCQKAFLSGRGGEFEAPSRQEFETPLFEMPPPLEGWVFSGLGGGKKKTRSPIFSKKLPPEKKSCGSFLLRSFPGNEARTLFWAQKGGCGQKCPHY